MPAKRPAATATAKPEVVETTPVEANGAPKTRKPRTPLPEGFGATAPNMLSFAAAPPRTHRGRSGGRSQWVDVAAQLKANPGMWAVVGVFTSAGNRPTQLKDAGITMKSVRKTDGNGSFAEGPNGEPMYELWAAYESE